MSKLLASGPVRSILDERGYRLLRNRSMHYEIRQENFELDARRPMLGIVEAMLPGRTFRDVDVRLRSVLAELSDALGSWT